MGVQGFRAGVQDLLLGLGFRVEFQREGHGKDPRIWGFRVSHLSLEAPKQDQTSTPKKIKQYFTWGFLIVSIV